MTDTASVKLLADTQQLHALAMDLAEQADMARLRGDVETWTKCIRAAFENERDAAGLLAPAMTLEPSRSILLRSAASLALECDEFRESERLVAIALSGDPPDEIAEELRDLLEQIHFKRHLALRGVTLGNDEVQFALAGKGIGFGIAPSEEYVDRVQTFEKIVFRTAERKMGIGYRERGSPDRDVRENFEVFVSVPRAASFAVTLKVGRKQEQAGFDFDKQVGADEVVDEIFYCFGRLNEGKADEVQRRIGNDAYFNNFMALAQKMAPDGDDVKVVGLSVVRGGRKRDMLLSRTLIPRKSRRRRNSGGFRLESALAGFDEGQEKYVEVIGKLKFADSTGSETGMIKLVDDMTSDEFQVIVPEGMMSDIVRPLWDYRVRVVGVLTDQGIRMENIERFTRR